MTPTQSPEAQDQCPGCAGPITYSAADADGVVVNFHCANRQCTYGKHNNTDVFVQATPMIGQDMVVFTAWEPWTNHSTQKWHDNRWYGKVGTKGPTLSELPTIGTAERRRFVGDWYNDQRRRAVEIILDHEPRLNEYGDLDYAAGQVTCGQEDLD